MLFIDTHTHLYAEQFEEDRDAMILRAIEAGITHFFLPNIDRSSIGGMNELVHNYPKRCFPMMGLHPCSVNDQWEEELKWIEKELENKKYIAVGEIGIDLYWDKTYLEEQQIAFRKQIQWAKEKNLPIVIHCREAFDEILAILDEVNDEHLKGIFHCFTGNLKQAQHILEYGNFKLGIGGVVTFKNAGLDKVLEKLSIHDIVLETDSPYLAPSPHRGKRNESSYLLKIAEKVAEILKLPLKEVKEISSKNALSIIKIHD